MTQPYFYIIEHIPTGKKYAGSRWMKNCHPSEFMKLDGYTTSSSYVNDIIKTEGIGAFNILEVIPMDNPYEYETRFLQENSCASSECWINLHNNDNVPPPYGSVEFKDIMMKKYGVTHNTYIPEVREQMTKKQKEFIKNNPDKVIARAKKIAISKINNGTTGKGTKRPHYTNNGVTGSWVRNEKHREAISNRQKENSHFISDNPMNDPEKRKLVSLSKIGKKKYINRQTNETKMYFPGNEPDGFILAAKGNNVNS